MYTFKYMGYTYLLGIDIFTIILYVYMNINLFITIPPLLMFRCLLPAELV